LYNRLYNQLHRVYAALHESSSTHEHYESLNPVSPPDKQSFQTAVNFEQGR